MVDHLPLEDDVSILDEDALLRRIPNFPNMYVMDTNLGRYRPSSVCFSDRVTANEQISVTHERGLFEAGGKYQDILQDENFGLASIDANFVRTQLSSPQVLVKNPTNDDPFHCLIVGSKSKKDQNKMAIHCRVLIEPKDAPSDG